MSLKLNSSGGGSVTLQEPVTASTLTLNLPAFSGTAATLATVTNNGVLFVNGSGQPTSGSALTFDGTIFAVGGAGQAGSYKLQSVFTSGNDGISIINGGNAIGDFAALSFVQAGLQKAVIYTNNNNLTINAAAGSAIHQIGGSEQMRLTSTGLGIGTSSPAFKLDVSAAKNTTNIKLTSTGLSSADDYGQLSFGDASSIYGAIRLGYNNPSANAASYLAFYNNSGSSTTERMRLDSSGNLGLGVTPSAWTNSFGVIQGLGGWSISHNGANSNSVDFLSNAYRSGGANTYLYVASSTATRYAQGAGAHQWFNAPSGTAGNAITFTQAMTLDASGNLGVGTTSPTQKLDVNGQFRAGQSAASAYQSVIFENTASNGFARAQFNVGSGGANGQGDVSYAPGIFFAMGPSANDTTTPIVFRNNNATERARIDSSGNLLVGTTSANGKFTSTATGSAYAGYFNYAGNAGQGVGINSVGAGTSYAMFFFNNGVSVGNILLTSTTTTYNTSSDYRLKNIKGPITSSGAYIDSLNPVEGTWKADGTPFVGLIAHEVQEASRTPVATGTKDGEKMQGMDYSSSEIIANLIAELQSLRARVATLESN